MIIDLFNIKVVHLSSRKRIGLLCCRVAVAISISLLILGPFSAIVSRLLTLEAVDVIQILLSWSGMMLCAGTTILEVVVVAVVPISSMVVASMVVHWVVMLDVSSKLTGSSPGIP